MIETVDDIVEQWADHAGIYGAHSELRPDWQSGCKCRVCFTAGLKDRIIAAVEVERKLAATEAWERKEQGK